MRIEKKPLGLLLRADYNPRSIDEKAMGALKSSMGMFGLVEPLVWNERTRRLVGGHQRLSVLEAEGVKEVEVVVVDLSGEEEMALNIALNNPLIEGDWSDRLSSVLGDVPDDMRRALNFDLLEAFAEIGDAGKLSKGMEVDIGGLTSDCDAKCPCCGFEWESDDKDYFEVEP
jgi:hypothetical protein